MPSGWGGGRGLDRGPSWEDKARAPGGGGGARCDAFRGSPGPVVEGFRLKDFKKQQIKFTMVSGAD